MLHAVSEHRLAQHRLTLATLALTRSAWDRMDFHDLEGSWARVAPLITRIVSSAQQGAARNAGAFVPAVLDEQPGPIPTPAGDLAPQGFAGWASDGRPLESLLGWSVTRTFDAQSLDAGRRWLDMAVQTQVADAGRQANQVAAFTRDVGYVRVAYPPCCQRCAVLAGKYSRSETAFLRHPRCDCANVPAKGATSVPGYVIGPEDVRDLTAAQRRAIADGADMNQVINAHKAGARSRNGMTTTEGATRRGTAGKRLGAGRGARARRLTPEGIYNLASDRTEALRLLRQHGYII